MKFNDIYNYILTEREVIDLSQHKGRSKEDRQKHIGRITMQKVRDYIRNKEVGDLDLSNTPITSLPADLRVGGTLRLDDTPIAKKYSKDEIRKMVPHVKGKIYTGK